MEKMEYLGPMVMLGMLCVFIVMNAMHDNVPKWKRKKLGKEDKKK
jgi:hypothetical protein